MFADGIAIISQNKNPGIVNKRCTKRPRLITLVVPDMATYLNVQQSTQRYLTEENTQIRPRYKNEKPKIPTEYQRRLRIDDYSYFIN